MKCRLAWIENENSRGMSLKKRRLGLIKKVKELTILCDVRGCIIMFSPNDADPMVWPSLDTTRDLLDQFFALPDIVKIKKETSLESYLKEKITKVQDHLMKIQKRNKEYGIDPLMDQLNRDRQIADLTFTEIYQLLSFSKDNIVLCRKRLGFVQYPPLRDPPMPAIGMHFDEFRTTTNDVPMRGDMADENINQAAERFSIGSAIMGDQSQYLIDQWVSPSPKPSEPINHQQTGMDKVSYNEYPNIRSHIPFHGSSSNGNPSLEMEPAYPPMMTFYPLGGPVSQHLDMNNIPVVATSQPRQYPFNSMTRELKLNEEENNINNGCSQFCRTSNNAIAINDVNRQEPPSTGTTGAGVSNVDTDINMTWPGFNNH